MVRLPSAVQWPVLAAAAQLSAGQQLLPAVSSSESAVGPASGGMATPAQGLTEDKIESRSSGHISRL